MPVTRVVKPTNRARLMISSRRPVLVLEGISRCRTRGPKLPETRTSCGLFRLWSFREGLEANTQLPLQTHIVLSACAVFGQGSKKVACHCVFLCVSVLRLGATPVVAELHIHHRAKAARGDFARGQLAAALAHEGLIETLRLIAAHSLVKVRLWLFKSCKQGELAHDHQLKAIVHNRGGPLLLRILEVRPQPESRHLRCQMVHLFQPVALLDPQEK